MPSSSSTPPKRRRWLRRTVIGVLVVVAVAVAAPFIFIHVIEKKAPPKLALRPSATGASTVSAAGSSAAVGGSWRVASGSVVGYRVHEVLFGQKTTAVGRTGDVSGHLTISGTSVPLATFTAQMGTVKSDQSGRDGQFRGRIMDTSTYPTATFALTKAIDLGTIPPIGKVQASQATGNLTLRGQTRQVTFTIDAKRTAGGIDVQGSIPITFSRWDIPNPSFGPISTDDNGSMEFLLDLTKS